MAWAGRAEEKDPPAAKDAKASGRRQSPCTDRRAGQGHRPAATSRCPFPRLAWLGEAGRKQAAERRDPSYLLPLLLPWRPEHPLLLLLPPLSRLLSAPPAAVRLPPRSDGSHVRAGRAGGRARGSPRQPAGGQQRASKGSWDSPPATETGKGAHPPAAALMAAARPHRLCRCVRACPLPPRPRRLSQEVAAFLPFWAARGFGPSGEKEGESGRGSVPGWACLSVSKDEGLGLGRAAGPTGGLPPERWKRKTGRLVSIVKTRSVCTLLESAVKSRGKVVRLHVLSAPVQAFPPAIQGRQKWLGENEHFGWEGLLQGILLSSLTRPPSSFCPSCFSALLRLFIVLSS